RGKKRIRKERSICLATQWDRNLERNNRVYFYLSDEELSKLNDRLEYYNSNNRSEFIRNSVLNNYIIINDDTNLRELVYEVNRRSEERRVGKECRFRWSRYKYNKRKI